MFGTKKVQINYKSGISVTIRVSELKVTRNIEGHIIALEWEDIKPRPLAVGINEIESIYHL